MSLYPFKVQCKICQWIGLHGELFSEYRESGQWCRDRMHTNLVERSCDLRQKVIALEGAVSLYPWYIYGLVTSEVTWNLKVFLQSRLVLVSVIVAHRSIYSFPQVSKPFLFAVINCLHLNSEHWVWLFELFSSQTTRENQEFEIPVCVYLSLKKKKIRVTKLVVIKVALIKHICFKWVNVERQLLLNCITGRAVLK